MLVVCERWVGDGDRLLHTDPKFFCHSSILAVLLNRGSLRAQALCLQAVLTLALVPNWLQLRMELNLNWLTDWPRPSVAPGYIVVWHPPASCGRTHLHRIQPRPQIKVIFRHPRPDAPAIYTGASLDWRLSRGWICNITGSGSIFLRSTASLN